MRLLCIKSCILLAVTALTVGATEPNEPPVRVPAKLVRETTDTLKPEKHDVVVYAEKGKFLGWPANEGIWRWGDEILMGFEMGTFAYTTATHSIAREIPSETRLVRSLDGGETWQLEPGTPFARPEYLEKPEMWGTSDAPKHLTLEEPLDFSAEGFAMKLRGSEWYHTQDKGHTWKGPYKLPDFGQKLIMARTDVIVLGPREAMIYLTASPTDGEQGQPFVAQTKNGGVTWEMLAWLGPELPKHDGLPTFSIMPSTVRVGENEYVTALRQRITRRKWTDVYGSTDGGKTWEYRSTPEMGGNSPSSMVQLTDGRLVLTYGWRGKPFGIRAKISEDAGRTWSKPIVLRDDGASWDIGYPRTVVRPDGKLFTAYYYHTAEMPEQHIAGTIWDATKLTPTGAMQH